MRKKTLAGAGALASVAVLVAAGSAMASNTLTVGGSATPAGNVSVTGTPKAAIGFVTDWDVPTTCTTASSTSGYVTRGASVTNGNVIGAITGFTFSSCTATDLGYPVVINKKPGNWNIEVVGTPAKSATTVNVIIRGVSAEMKSTGSAPYACAVNATGNVPATFNLTTQQLTVTSTAFALSLDALDANASKAGSATSSCGGEIQDGDLAAMTGSFTLSTGGAGAIGMV